MRFKQHDQYNILLNTYVSFRLNTREHEIICYNSAQYTLNWFDFLLDWLSIIACFSQHLMPHHLVSTHTSFMMQLAGFHQSRLNRLSNKWRQEEFKLLTLLTSIWIIMFVKFFIHNYVWFSVFEKILMNISHK